MHHFLRVSKNRQRGRTPQTHHTAHAMSYRKRLQQRNKKSTKRKSFYFWLPFMLVFFIIVSCVVLAWAIHSDTDQKLVGRSGGQSLWGEKEIKLASGDKSIPIEILYTQTYTSTENNDEDGMPKWKKNAVNVENPNDAPMIAIVIDDLGVRKNATENVLDLPAPLTLSFLTYAQNFQAQAEKALEKGHEVLLHIPMEPYNNNPGYPALLVNMTDAELIEKLDKMLETFSKNVGVNNHMGSKFTSDPHAMNVVLKHLKQEGLLFLDSLTSRHSVGYKTAVETQIPFVSRDIFLDNARQSKKVTEQLVKLEKKALKKGYAVGIGHPHQATIKALQAWIPKALEKGFILVPISTIAAQEIQ